MTAKKSAIWLVAALTAAGLFTMALSAMREQRNTSKPPQPVAAPNPFPFVKPLGDASAVAPSAAPKTAMSNAARVSPAVLFSTEKEVRKLRVQGGSEDEIYRKRAAALSPETAELLAQHDRMETAWKARVASYLAERNNLRAENMNESDTRDAVQRLRDASFTAEEQKWLAAVENAEKPHLILPSAGR